MQRVQPVWKALCLEWHNQCYQKAWMIQICYWEIQSLCNDPKVCFWGTDLARTPLFPFVLVCSIFLLWKKPSKPHIQMSRINAYVLKMKEGTTRFGWFCHLVWFCSLGGETNWPRWVKRNRDRATETITIVGDCYHSGERTKSQWKSWEAGKEVQTFLIFTEDLLPSEKYWGTEHTH